MSKTPPPTNYGSNGLAGKGTREKVCDILDNLW